MEVVLTANSDITIRDLGIILQTGQSINLLDNFTTEDVLASQDIIVGDHTITIDSNIVDYNEMVDRISSLTKHQHNDLKIIQHNLYEENHFVVMKEGDKSKFITYYKDNTLAEKIQEDEIVRGVDGKVSQIITRKYSNGVLYQEMIQILNRGLEGKVESISTNTL